MVTKGWGNLNVKGTNGFVKGTNGYVLWCKRSCWESENGAMFNLGTLVPSFWLEAYQTVWKIVPSCMKNIREYARISREFPRELHSEIRSLELHRGYKRERHFSVRTSDSGSNSEHHLYTDLSVTSVFDHWSLRAQVSPPKWADPLSRTRDRGEHVRAAGRGPLRHFHREHVRTSRTSESSTTVAIPR